MSFAGPASGGFESVKLDPLKCRDGSRPRILLAEDSAAARVLTGALLKRIGCNVDAAEHGEEAVNFVKNHQYDLILMDIEMPVMDGVVAAKEIRTMGGAAAQTPIVALSAFLADTQKSAYWQKHFDVALAKPAGKKQLYAAIRDILELQPEKNAPVDEPRAEKLSVAGLGVDEHKLTRILANICDDDKVMLLNTACAEISKNASELAIGHYRSNHQDIAIALHKLCGLSATFAATGLHEMVMSMRRQIAQDEITDLGKEVQAVCECAERTVQSLKLQTLNFPGVLA